MAKILIVEDFEKMRNELSTFLQNNGYQTSEITNFNNLLQQINDSDSDLILLDITLPFINGEYLLKEIRKTNMVPIIMVTSHDNETDELISINYGADDYITKPYNPQILLARIERILKRYHNTNTIITYQDITLDTSKGIISKDSINYDLSRNEFKIFAYLLIKRGHIVSRDELINHLWESDTYVDDNTLTVNINRLRKTLKNIGNDGVIITKRGEGYIIL